MTSARELIRSTLKVVALTLCVTLLASTPTSAQDLLIRGGTVITITNGDLPNTDVLIRDGKIAEIGENLEAPEGVRVIDAEGRFVMPGILDDHSHMGVDRGINEGSRSVVPEVRIADVIRHDDPAFFTALAGGITTIHTMHGSANSIGGQNETIKIKWGRPWEDLVIPDAPMTLKMALGENVRRSSSPNPTRYPRSRSGVAEVMRESFTKAQDYLAAQEAYQVEKAVWDRANRRRRGPEPIPPKRDLQLEALADALTGRSILRVHAYRADEMAMILEVAEEFNIPPGVFEHALDAYKIAPEMARAGWATSVFADSWGYKIEAYEAIPYKMLIHYEHGVRTSINSDSAERVRRLYQEAARGVKYGGIPENECLKMITINAAMNLGIDHRVGSIEVGKDGDIAIFSHYPLQTETRVEMTIIEGEVFFDRSQTDVAANWVLDPDGEKGETMNPGEKGDVTMKARMTRRISGALALVLMMVLPAIAEAQQNDFAITGGTVVTVTGSTIPNGTVLIQDGIITAVGANVTIPPEIEQVDATGMYVYPGLIDAATGLGLQEAGGMAGPVDNFELGPYNPHIEAYIGVDHTSEMLGVQRVGGFTTVVTGLNGRGEPIPGYDSMIDLWGWTPQDMAVEKRIGLRVNWDSAKADDLKAYFLEGKAFAARKAMNERGELADFEWDVRMDGMIPVVTGEVPVIFEAREEEDIKAAVEFAEELDLRYLIRGGSDAWKMIDFLVEHEVKLIFVGVHRSPGREEPYDVHYATPALLHEAGVDFAIASGGVSNVFSLTYEAGMAVGYGLPMEKALRSLTIDAARILGVDDRLGSIEEGKVANLLITTGNPVEYTSQLLTMFIRGEAVPWDDKFNRLLRRYRRTSEISY